MNNELATRRKLHPFARTILVLILLYFFLASIELMGISFTVVGKEKAGALFATFQNPFAGLFVGVLATVMVQSSSVTTATIVGLVGGGTLSLEAAVPMVMGANIGTTVTNTLVSVAHVTNRDDFRRAFAGATVHDFFNLFTVAILLPLEMATGLLQKTAVWLSHLLPQAGGKMPNPLKDSVKFVAGGVEQFFCGTLGLSGWYLSIALFLVAIVTIIIALVFITKNMKQLMANRIETILNRALDRSPLVGLAAGTLITVAVQSSSITTSLLIPLFAAGLLRLNHGLPLMIGANIGTTITALLASMVKELPGLQIALVHLLFNLSGMLLFLPFPFMSRIPIWCAERLAETAVRNRLWVVAYVGFVFVGLPFLGIGLSRWLEMW